MMVAKRLLVCQLVRVATA